MKYIDLLKSHEKYGTTKENIKERKKYDDILENVVVAPWWEHTIFEKFDVKIEKMNDKVYNIYGDGYSFSYIQLKQIGAPVILDEILSLGVTECKNLIFIGSVGSLDKEIGIGDIVIPEYSICGDGASRYLNDNLQDCFGEKVYPNSRITEILIKNVQNIKDVRYNVVPNFSVDTVFAQFMYIDYIKNLGCKAIEMETAALFKVSNMIGIKCSALLCVSDNTIVKKSLYSGRTEEENNYRHKVRADVIPDIIINTFKEL